MTRDEAMNLFRRRAAAWCREDLDTYLGFFAEDLVFQSPMHIEAVRGLASYTDLVRRSAEMVRPLSFEIHDLAVHGDVVLAEWTIATELRNSGRRMEWRGMSVCEIRDGKIARWREYWNPKELGL